MRNQRFGHCFLGNLLFFFSGIPPCCSGVCFNLLRGLFFSAHGISPRHSAHLFSFASRIYFNSCTPPAAAFCSCTLNVSCFHKSLVVHAHRARPRLPSCKGLRSKECPRRRMKKAFRHHRTTTDRKANNLQCAE